MSFSDKTIALQALLGSLAPGLGESSAQNGTKLSPQLVKKLSEKLGELAGDVESNDVGPNRNEKGEVSMLCLYRRVLM